MPRSSSHRGNLYPPITCLILLSKFMDNRLKAGTRELKEVSQEVRGISPKCKAASCLVKLGAWQGADRMPSKAVREGAGTPGSHPHKKKNQRNGYWATQEPGCKAERYPTFGKWHFCVHYREVAGLCQMLGFSDLLKVRNWTFEASGQLNQTKREAKVRSRLTTYQMDSALQFWSHTDEGMWDFLEVLFTCFSSVLSCKMFIIW